MRWALILLVAGVSGEPPQKALPPTPSKALPGETFRTAEVDIRSVDGEVIVSAADIVEYEWATHTMRWRREALIRVFHTEDLAHDGSVSFAICVGGKPVYYARSMFSGSSFALDTVALINPVWEKKDADELVQIGLGYPTPKFFVGTDPRSDPAIRSSLHAAGKLKTIRQR